MLHRLEHSLARAYPIIRQQKDEHPPDLVTKVPTLDKEFKRVLILVRREFRLETADISRQNLKLIIGKTQNCVFHGQCYLQNH